MSQPALSQICSREGLAHHVVAAHKKFDLTNFSFMLLTIQVIIDHLAVQYRYLWSTLQYNTGTYGAPCSTIQVIMDHLAVQYRLLWTTLQYNTGTYGPPCSTIQVLMDHLAVQYRYVWKQIK